MAGQSRRVQSLQGIGGVGVRTVAWVICALAVSGGASWGQPPAPPAFDHPCMYLDAGEIARLRERIRSDALARSMADRVVAGADQLLSRSPEPVVGPFRNVLIPPLPSDPSEVSFVSTHGQIARRDLTAARNLGIAYMLTGDERYAAKVAEFAAAWVGAMEAKLPNTYSAWLMLARTLPALYYAVDLCWDSPSLTDELKGQIKTWVGAIAAQAKEKHLLCTPYLTAFNLNLIAASGVICEDRGLVEFAYNTQDNPDAFQGLFRGSKDTTTGKKMPGLFDGSGKANYETNQDAPVSRAIQVLKALTYVAELARHQGQDLYAFEYRGAGLRSAFLYYAPDFSGARRAPDLSPFRGAKGDAAVYELAFARYGDPAMLSVLRFLGRDLVDPDVLGPIGLTHGVATDVADAARAPSTAGRR